jgi:hypothetical protein
MNINETAVIVGTAISVSAIVGQAAIVWWRVGAMSKSSEDLEKMVFEKFRHYDDKWNEFAGFKGKAEAEMGSMDRRIEDLEDMEETS